MLSVLSGFVLPAKLRRPGLAAATALMLVALLAGCVRGATAAIEVPVDPAVVQTKEGALRGTVAADHRLFAGIPYAAPPVGPLRWQPPAAGAELGRVPRRHPAGPEVHPGCQQRRRWAPHQ